MTEAEGHVMFVQTVDQLQVLKEKHLEVLTNARVIGLAPHLSLGHAIAEEPVDFCYYTDFLTSSDYALAAEEARRISHSWFTDFVEPPDAATLEVLESVRLGILQWLSEILLTHQVVSHALEHLSPKQVILAGGIDCKVEAVIAHEVERRGISLESLDLDTPAKTADSRGVHKIWQYLRQMAHNVWPLARHWLQQLLNPKPVLLSFGSEVDFVNQQQLLPSIEGAGIVRPILVRAGEINRTAFNRPGRSEYPYLYFVPLRSMLQAKRHLPQCRRWWQIFRQGQQIYQGPYPFLFANPRLDTFFERIFLYLLPHAMATLQDVRALLRLLKPQLVFTGNEVSFSVRSLVLEAKRRDISTLGLIHSGLNNMHYRDFQSDRMAVWGKVHVRDFVQVLNKQPSQLFPIGNPHYDTLTCNTTPSDSSHPRYPRILVLTAISQWQMFHFDLRKHEQAWREVERLAEFGLQVIVKPHPRFDDYAFYRCLQPQISDWRENQPGIALAPNVYLEEVLPTCDLVVVPNFPTTAALEAMVCQKPVIHLMCGYEEVAFCTSIAPGSLVIREVEGICSTILEVIHTPELSAQLVRQGQEYLDEFLGPRDGRATQRLADLIAGIVEERI